MESTRSNFLSWSEIQDKVQKDEELNPIDRLLYEFTPSDERTTEEFRTMVYEAVNHKEEE